MMRGGALVLLFVLAMGSARADAGAMDKAHPVSKVIALMKDMVKQLDKEAEEDEETYETMGCWCETNDKEKTKAITDAEARIEALGTLIEEITGLNEEIAKNTEALDTAAALRTKQLAEFNTDEKDSIGSITSLKSAVTTLGKHNEGAFLQMSDQEQLKVIVTVRTQLDAHKDLLAQVLTPQQRQVLEAFAQQAEGAPIAMVQQSAQQPA